MPACFLVCEGCAARVLVRKAVEFARVVLRCMFCGAELEPGDGDEGQK